MTSRIALAVAAALSCGGCALFGTELRSIPTVGPEISAVYACPSSDVHQAPPAGPERCFSVQGVSIEVEAKNAEPVAGAIGPFPLVPFFHQRRSGTEPLTIELGFKTDEPYAFSPWDVSLQTDQGVTVRVSGVSTNVRYGYGVHTVAIDPRDAGARTLQTHKWSHFFLTFAKHIAPDHSFALTLHFVAPDGADVRIPIEFKKGKVSYLWTIP